MSIVVDSTQLDRLRGTRIVRRSDVAALLSAYEESQQRLAAVEEELAEMRGAVASLGDSIGMPGASLSGLREVMVRLAFQLGEWSRGLSAGVEQVEKGEDR